MIDFISSGYLIRRKKTFVFPLKIRVTRPVRKLIYIALAKSLENRGQKKRPRKKVNHPTEPTFNSEARMFN